MGARRSLTRQSNLILILCFAVAVIEGFDLQAAGVAAPLLTRALQLAPNQMGLFLTAATVGLIIGALLGGRIADWRGRQAGLVFALVIFGIFSVATGFAHDFEALFLMRFFTGIGLGAALPNLVAITAEVARPGRTASGVAIMYAGMPCGGALAAFLSILGLKGGWATIFFVGGLSPIFVLPLLAWYLPPLRPDRMRGAGGMTAFAALFQIGRRSTTFALWSGFFCALLILYLLLNWLPLLLVARGLGREQAGTVQILFNAAGAVSSVVIGRAMDGQNRVHVAIVMFILLVATLIIMAVVPANFALVLAAGAAVGMAVMPVQAILYGLAPSYYPPQIRGTGVGAAVAAGRLGSVAGPLLAGVLLRGGHSGSEVLAAIVPIAAIAAAATIWLMTRPLPQRLESVADRDAIASRTA